MEILKSLFNDSSKEKKLNKIGEQFYEVWKYIEQGKSDLYKMLSKYDDSEYKNIVKNIDSELKKLSDDPFTISVCGVVKAGKSTFLNSYLFGDKTLPAFETPLTAKITRIEYTPEKNHFKVNFYTKDEWEALLNDYKHSGKEDLYKQLMKRVKKCSESYGETEGKCIGAVTKTVYDLQKLGEFVTDPEECEEARYTPYVRDVCVYVNNKNIENVRIVDTPGLHDANIINSEETKKWIKNSHAIVFLLPKKGFELKDLNFFKEEFSSQTSDQRIFVINKIDDLEDGQAEEVREEMYNYGRVNIECKNMGLFNENEIICRYSGLIKLLKDMKAKRLPLTEDDEWHLEGCEINPDPDNVFKKIEQRLFQNKGKIRIKTASDVITNAYKKLIENKEMQIAESKDKINDAKKSSDELQKEIDELKEIKEELDTQNKKGKEEIEEKCSSHIDDIIQSIRSECDRLVPSVSGMNYDQLKEVHCDFTTNIIRAFESRGSIEKNIRKMFKSLKEYVDDEAQEIRKIYLNHEIEDLVILHYIDKFKSGFNQESLRNKFINKVQKSIDDVLPWNRFTQIFTFDKTMQSEVRKVMKETVVKLERHSLHELETIESNFKDYINNIFGQLLKVNLEKIDSKRRTSESQQNDKKRVINELTSQIESNERILSEINECIINFKNTLQGII